MTWKVTKKAEGWEPVAGAPGWVDLTDDEFAAADKAYQALGFPVHSLRDSGFWEHVEDKADKSSEKKEG